MSSSEFSVSSSITSTFILKPCWKQDQSWRRYGMQKLSTITGKALILDAPNSKKINVFRLVLQLYLPNPLKPGVKSRMKM